MRLCPVWLVSFGTCQVRNEAAVTIDIGAFRVAELRKDQDKPVLRQVSIS